MERYCKHHPITNRTLLQSDYQTRSIWPGSQQKHILGENNYIQGRSFIVGGKTQAQSLVDQFCGTGKILRAKTGIWKHTEYVQTKQIVGYVLNLD